MQLSTQKPAEQQAQQARVFTGKDAQRIIMQGVSPVCEQMLLKIHGV